MKPDYRTVCAVGATFLLICSAHAQSVNEALVESWALSWERVIDNALGQYLQRAADGPLSDLESEARDSALQDLYFVLYPEISWDALGETVLDNMLASCPSEVLANIAPFIAGNADKSSLDPQITQDYSSCAQAGISSSMEAVSFAIQGKYEEISATYAKYGVKYP